MTCPILNADDVLGNNIGPQKKRLKRIGLSSIFFASDALANGYVLESKTKRADKP